MERRRLCKLLAGISLGVTTGCVSSSDPAAPSTPPRSPTPTPTPTPTPRPGVEIVSRRVKPGPEGNFQFDIIVRNTAPGPRPVTLFVVVNARAVDYKKRKERTVEVPAETKRTVTFTFDVSFADWAKDGGVNYGKAQNEAE